VVSLKLAPSGRQGRNAFRKADFCTVGFDFRTAAVNCI